MVGMQPTLVCLLAAAQQLVIGCHDLHMQVVHGAQTTKVNIDGGRATGVTFVVKGPDGRRHTGQRGGSVPRRSLLHTNHQ
jgi:hypothetical protein